MKKILLTALIAVSVAFTSCKENTKKEINSDVTEIGKDVEKGLNNLENNIKEGYSDAKESVASTFNDIEIPKLNDTKAEEYLKSYANYIKKQANKGAENIKNAEFVKETKEFGEKSEMFLKNLGTEAKISFKATMSKIDAKAKEIENEIKK